ncbi:hypothetical protein D3C87_1613710 [compost metagenome]
MSLFQKAERHRPHLAGRKRPNLHRLVLGHTEIRQKPDACSIVAKVLDHCLNLTGLVEKHRHDQRLHGPSHTPHQTHSKDQRGGDR